MLSEQVLEYLARHTPLQEHLVTLAWPDLTTESRLQLIEACQRGKSMSHWTPEWLMKLAISEKAPVVRYWAARHFWFKDGSGENHSPFFGTKATELDKELHAKATADSEWLVAATVESADFLSLNLMSEVPQKQRLAFLRHADMLLLPTFIHWLDKAVEAGLPDGELLECAEEAFSHPTVQEGLRRHKMDYDEGSDAYYAGTAVTIGWKLVHKAGPRLSKFLSYYLPTTVGLGRVTPEELASLPAAIIRGLGYRAGDNEEVLKALDLVLKHPERYSDEVSKAAAHAEGTMTKFDAPEAEKRQTQAAIDKSRATLDVVLALQEQVQALTRQVQELTAETVKKRGFFS